MMSSPISSAPSSPSPASINNNLSAQLDSQIARLNAQINTIRQQKQHLSQTLLASSTVQKLVQLHKPAQHESAEDSVFSRLKRAVEEQQKRNDIKVARLVNNVTTFPFTDPAPERQQDASMLGLRFEMPFTQVSSNTSVRIWKNEEEDDTEGQRVYLVMLRRIQYRRKTYLQLQPEMNQIPKHIDVEGYAAQYLPVPDIDDENDRTSLTPAESESFQDDSGIDVTQDLTQIINGMNGHQTATSNTITVQQAPVDLTDTNQSLTLFVTTTRNALLSWHYRKSYIQHIIASLILTSKSETTTYKHCIADIQPKPPASELGIDWVNGTTAILGIDEKGYVSIARVFGPRLSRDDEELDGHAEGTYRCHSVERKLEGARLSELLGRLEEVGRMMSE